MLKGICLPDEGLVTLFLIYKIKTELFQIYGSMAVIIALWKHNQEKSSKNGI